MREQEPLTVWLIAGHPNAGKSTMGRALARRLGAALLDQDVLTNPLMQQISILVGSEGDFDHPAIVGEVRNARYDCLLDAATDNLAVGRSAVLVAPFSTEVRDRHAYDVLVSRLQPALVRLVWVEVSPEIAALRRNQRNLPRDLSGSLDSRPLSRPPVPHAVVDGAADAEAEADRLIASTAAH